MTPVNPHVDSQSQASSVHTQLSLYTAAGLAGMVTGMLLARAPLFEALIQRVGRKASRRADRPTQAQSLPMLASAILGSPKATIHAVLGPPRSAVVPHVGVVVRPQHVYWQSDTWYYPLRSTGPLAIAIGFDQDIASKVEFFTAPRVSH